MTWGAGPPCGRSGLTLGRWRNGSGTECGAPCLVQSGTSTCEFLLQVGNDRVGVLPVTVYAEPVTHT